MGGGGGGGGDGWCVCVSVGGGDSYFIYSDLYSSNLSLAALVECYCLYIGFIYLYIFVY